MKKIILVLMLGVFLTSFIPALDSQTFVSCGGDDETIFVCGFGDGETTFFGGLEEIEDDKLPEDKEDWKVFLMILVPILLFFIIIIFIIKRRKKKKDEE